MRADLDVQSPAVAHGFPHTGHEMLNGFLNNPQFHWLSRSGDMLFIKGHEQQLVPLVHPFNKRFRNRQHNNWLTDGGEVVSLTCWPPFTPPGRFLVFISVRG
jgi:hypothetical protein